MARKGNRDSQKNGSRESQCYETSRATNRDHKRRWMLAYATTGVHCESDGKARLLYRSRSYEQALVRRFLFIQIEVVSAWLLVHESPKQPAESQAARAEASLICGFAGGPQRKVRYRYPVRSFAELLCCREYCRSAAVDGSERARACGVLNPPSRRQYMRLWHSLETHLSATGSMEISICSA
jgi:hypothetical protein